MAIIGETRSSNSHDSEVDGPGESDSRDSDTNNTDFIVWLREEFAETQRKECLLNNLGVSGSQAGITQSISSPELAE